MKNTVNYIGIANLDNYKIFINNTLCAEDNSSIKKTVNGSMIETSTSLLILEVK